MKRILKSKGRSPAKTKPKAKVRTKSARKTEVNKEVEALCMDIRRRRERRSMTLEQYAELSYLTPNYIGTVEHGLRDPSLTTMHALADGLGIPLSEIFGPTQPLSPVALEMARMFNEAPEDLRTSLLRLLHAMVKPRRAKPALPK